MSAAAQKLTVVESTELVAKVKTPVVITGNFEEVRAYFAEELKKYDVVVTADTLADAKKLATELNKTATEVKKRGKVITDEAMAPIDEVKSQVKELAQMLLDGRAKLTAQIATFEDEVRAAAFDALNSYRNTLWDSKGVQPEFRHAEIESLVNLSTLTAKGSLSSKAKAAVDALVNDNMMLQQQTQLRLANLKADSLEAGLSVALERRHVEQFLFADENEYTMRLKSLLEAEIQREQQAQENMRKRMEQEQQRQAEAQQRAAQAELARQESEKRQAEQQARHEAEMQALRQQQAETPQQSLAPVETSQPQQAPISMDAVAVKHAYADIGNLNGGKPAYQYHVGTTAETMAAVTEKRIQQVGVWTQADGLVAVVLTGATAQQYLNQLKGQ